MFLSNLSAMFVWPCGESVVQGYVGRRLRMETAADWNFSESEHPKLTLQDSSFHGRNSVHDH